MDIPVWVISLLISFCGLLLTALSILLAKTANDKKDHREMGGLLAEIKNMRDDIQDGNKNMKDHLLFCRGQCDKLIVVERDVKVAHKRIDGHDDKLSKHDQEIEDLRRLREVRHNERFNTNS